MKRSTYLWRLSRGILFLTVLITANRTIAQTDFIPVEQAVYKIQQEQKTLIYKMGPIALELDSALASLSGSAKVDHFYKNLDLYASQDLKFSQLLDAHRLLEKQVQELEAQSNTAFENNSDSEAMFQLPDARKLGIPKLPESILNKDWSWDKIHRYIVIRKRRTAFTEDELRTIASFDMIQMASDQGSLDLAKELKAINPNMICIGYRNVIIWHETFDTDLFRNNPNWFLKNFKTGAYETHGSTGQKAQKPLFDLRVPAMRDWWIKDVASQCDQGVLDGILIDAFAKVLTGWGPKRRSIETDPQATKEYNRIFTDELLLRNIRENGHKGLIIGNTLRSGYPDALKSFVDVYLHGSYMEWIEGNQEHYEEGLSSLLDALIQIGKDPGDKVLCFQFGAHYPPPPKVKVENAQNHIPESTIMPEMGEHYDARNKTHEDIVKEMREAFPYKLAIFLIGANKYSYMGYASTVVSNDGLERWAPQYPEHNKKIGRPLGHATKKGKYYYEREFEHVSVKLNVETREAVLTWK